MRPIAAILACAVAISITPVCSQSPLPSTPAPSSASAMSASAAVASPAATASAIGPANQLAQYLPLIQTLEATSTFSLPANNYEIGEGKQILEVPRLTKVTCRATYKRTSQSASPDLSLDLKASEPIYIRAGSNRIKLDGAALSNDKFIVSGAFSSLVASIVEGTSAPAVSTTAVKFDRDVLKDICVESLLAETVKDCKGSFSDFQFSAPNGATVRIKKCKVSFAKTLDGEINLSVPGLSLKDKLGRKIDLDGLTSNLRLLVKPDGAGLVVTAKELGPALLEFVKLSAKGPEGVVSIGRASVPSATISFSLSPDNKISKPDVRGALSLNGIQISPGADAKLLLETGTALKTDLHYANDGAAHLLEIQTPIKLADLSLQVKNGSNALKCRSTNNVIPSCSVRLSQDIEVKLPSGVHLEPSLNDENATLFNQVPGIVESRSPVRIVVDANSKVSCSGTTAHIEFPVVSLKSGNSTKKFKNVVGDIRVKDIYNDQLRLFLKASLGDFEDSNRKVLSFKSTPTFFSGDIQTSLNTPGRIECAVEKGTVQVPFVILNRFITAYLPKVIDPPFSVPFADLRSLNKLNVDASSGERLDLACGLSSKVKVIVTSYEMVHFGTLSCKLDFHVPEQTVGVSGVQGIKFKPRLIDGKPPGFWDKVAGKAVNVVAKLVSGFFEKEFALKEITKNIDGIKDIQFQELKHSDRDVLALFNGRFSFSTKEN